MIWDSRAVMIDARFGPNWEICPFLVVGAEEVRRAPDLLRDVQRGRLRFVA